jgi:hypothetical protein
MIANDGSLGVSVGNEIMESSEDFLFFARREETISTPYFTYFVGLYGELCNDTCNTELGL